MNHHVIVLTEAELSRALSSPQALKEAYQSLHHAKNSLAHVETIFWAGLRRLGINSLDSNIDSEEMQELQKLRKVMDKTYHYICDAQSILNPIADAIDRHSIKHEEIKDSP
jgi:hypothetical protein